MGTEFRVKGDSLKRPNGSYVVHLIEIDDNNDQPLPLASAMNQMQLTGLGKLFIIFLYQKTSFKMTKNIRLLCKSN